ncbi:hypothetical protein H2201_008645 [Coniosporium apollinis]|uniref:Uncharacterized protein n=1 Tax=Coniosporium apollinis TaxID=61459 RepID=A0ABQ9NIE1_9PEZI|nr:hypothetical protein H2201_008645 [Coniosporium apollinis]
MVGRGKEVPKIAGWQDTAPGQEEVAVAAGNVATVDAPAQLVSWLEPSMANEGALWFQDLTVADPTLTLPFVVSGIMFLNVWRGSAQTKRVGRESVGAKTLRRGLLLLTLAIGPLTLNVPAGVMVYWMEQPKAVDEAPDSAPEGLTVAVLVPMDVDASVISSP